MKKLSTKPSSDPSLSLTLFGSLQVRWHDRFVTDFVSRKAEALLVYLALHPRPHAREILADLLWDDRTQKQALGNLRVLLSNLRKLFPDLLLIDRQTVRFHSPTAVTSDAHHLQAILNALDDQPLTAEGTTTLAAALDAYCVPFLQGFHIRDARRFEEWLLIERERWQRLALRGFEQLALAYASQQKLDEGVTAARRLVQLDPLREHAQQLQMRLLARQGHPHAALQAYDSFVILLQAELGVPPEPETTRLAQRIRQAKTASPYHLPQPITPLVGRQAELHIIQQRLDDPAVRLLTIIGIGGMGKTRLALAAAHQRRHDYLNGICFVSLSSAESRDDSLLLLADALRLPLEGKEAPLDQISNFLHQREMLLLLDNVEPIIDAVADVVQQLLTKAPDVQFLLTSRERLQLRQEWVLPLAGLSVVAEEGGDGEEATATSTKLSASVTLLQQRAAQFAPTLTSSATRSAALYQISQLVAGVPLALELAAATFASHTPEQVAAELQQSIDFLHSQLRDLPDRHRSMRAVFAHSWQRLTAEEQAVFSGLSLFRGGFSGAAAESVTGCTRSVLVGLVAKSLLVRLDNADSGSGQNGRYALHSLLRQFAAEKLAAHPQQHQTYRAHHTRFFIGYLDRQQQQFQGETMIAALDAVAAEIDNLRAVWRRLVDAGDVGALQQMMVGYTIYFYTRSLFQPGLAELSYAYNHLDSQETDTVGLCAEIRARQALFLCEIGAYEACVQAANEACALVDTDTGEEYLGVIALAELCQGYAHWSQGDYATAQTYLETAVTTAASPDLGWIKAQSLNTLGNVMLDRGDIPAAHTYYAQALTIAEPAGQQRIQASIHINTGNAHWHNGDFHAARQQFQQALALATGLGMTQLKSLALLNSGLVETEIGDHPAGIAHMQQALQLSRDVGDRRGEGNVLVNLIAAFMEAHRLGEAGELLDDALTVCREVGDKQGEAIALALAADWHLAVGEYDRAETLLAAVAQLCQAIDDAWGLMEMQLSRAQLYSRRGLLDQVEPPALSLAEVAVREGLAQTQTLQDQANEAKAYTLLGTILMHKEDYAEAVVAYETAVSLRHELGQTHLLIEAQAGQFYCQQVLGQPSDDTEMSQLVDTLMASPLNGILMPGQLFYTVWQLLLTQKNPRAAELQQHGVNFLQEVADSLSEAVRHTFLTELPAHQALLSDLGITA